MQLRTPGSRGSVTGGWRRFPNRLDKPDKAAAHARAFLKASAGLSEGSLVELRVDAAQLLLNSLMHQGDLKAAKVEADALLGGKFGQLTPLARLAASSRRALLEDRISEAKARWTEVTRQAREILKQGERLQPSDRLSCARELALALRAGHAPADEIDAVLREVERSARLELHRLNARSFRDMWNWTAEEAELDAALTLGKDSVTKSRTANSPGLVAELNVLATLSRDRGDLQGAEAFVLEASALRLGITRETDVPERIRLWSAAAGAAIGAGHFGRASEDLEKVVAAARRNREPESLRLALVSLSRVRQQQDCFARPTAIRARPSSLPSGRRGPTVFRLPLNWSHSRSFRCNKASWGMRRSRSGEPRRSGWPIRRPGSKARPC